jgi:PAS domain S-box-containing protein
VQGRLAWGGEVDRMDDHKKSRDELIRELSEAHRRISVLESAEHQHTSEALRESEERLRRVVQNMPVMMDAFDAEGNIIVWNGECERVSGYQQAEIVGNPKAMEWLYPDPAYREQMMSEWKRRGDDYRVWEWEMTCKDGSVKTVAWSNISQRFPVPGWATWGVGVDLTERKKWERALEESEQTIRAIFDACSESVILFDLEGTVLSLNEIAAARLGSPVDELVGKCIFELFPPELVGLRKTRLSQVIRSREPIRFEEERAGIAFESACYPILGPDGNVERVAVFARDITDRKRVDVAIRREQQRLRRLLEMYERDRKLAAYEIHDGFVQSLTGALMTLEGTLRGVREQWPGDIGEGYDRAIQLLRESLRQARRLIGGLRPAGLEQFGLVPAIESLVYESQGREEPVIEYVHRVQFDRLAAPLEAAIFRIVQEALANACHHSKSQKVRVGLFQEGDHVRVEVEDWGVGFDPQKVGRDRFGLEGIRERARLFDGHATIQSAPGKGTRITAQLPLVGIGPGEPEERSP